MSDVEDELLALAGSDEDESGSEREPSRSPEPAGKRAEAKSGRGVAVKKGKRRGKQDDSEDEEEGEASSGPGSPNSLESAPMEESDSETEQPSRPELSIVAVTDEGEKYPVEGLYASVQEKAEIMRMREVDRETILAERREEAHRYKQNRLLRQLVSAQEEKEKEQRRKRSADEADLEDGRKSSRQRAKVTESTSSGIDALRRQRAEKNDRQRRREEGRDREEKTTPRKSARNQDGYGEDGNEEWSRQKTPEVEKRGKPDADLADFQRLRVSRTNFAEVCFKPGFEKVMVDCYVRVLGKPAPGQANKYHIVPIKSITTGKAYAMDDASGKKQMIVDQYFVAGIGKRTETYPFIAASTGKFTQDEVDDYKRLLQERGMSFPKHSALDAKLDELLQLVSYKLTNDEITQMVEKKAFLRKKYDPAMREQLVRSIEEAKISGNTIYARQLQDELDALGKPVGLAFRTSLANTASAKTANSQQERLALLNAENRRRNMENVRRAQLQERSRAKEIDQKTPRGENAEDDPSKRLKTRAKMVHGANETPKGSRPGSGASTPANGTPRMGPSKGLPEVAKLQEKKFEETKGIPTIHKPLNDDDIIASLDFDIDDINFD